MPIEGWIHPVHSELEAKALVKFIDGYNGLSLKHFAILNGTLKTRNGRILGQENGRTLLIMYNSFGERKFLKDLDNESNINSDSLVTLNDLKDDDKEYIGGDIEDELGVGLKVKKADYIDWGVYYDYDTDKVISDFFQNKEIITISFDNSEYYL